MTPREWALRLQGAGKARLAQRRMLAEAAWVGAHADKAGIAAYLRHDAPGEPMSPEGLDRMLRSSSVGLRVVSIEDYLASKRGRE